MVLRPTIPTARDQTRQATEQLEDVKRAQGRGIGELRDSAGHVLHLDAGSDVPMLIPDNTDMSLMFRDRALEVRDPTGTAFRDLKARDIQSGRDLVASRDIHAQQDVIASANMACTSLIAELDIHAKQDLIATANVACTSLIANLDVHAKQNLIATANVACRSVLASVNVEVPNGSVNVGYAVNCTTLNAYVINDLPSSRRLKRDIAPVEESALDAVAAAPLYWWRYEPDAVEGVDAERWRKGPMVDDLPADAVTDPDDGNGPRPELMSMVRYAWGAIAELKAKVDEQAEQIAALTARVEALGG